MLNDEIVHKLKIFDSHFHIIDKRFPLAPNNGYLPASFTVDDYLSCTKNLNLVGGAVVSGSFQAFDQAYLLATLETLGRSFVGVTQLPASVSDDQIVKLKNGGVRAVRFNLRRGGSEGIEQLEILAKRVHEIAGWHVELYIDSEDLFELYPILVMLPCISIDHLGLSKSGFPVLLKLVEKGAYVKASGFGRVNFDVAQALKEIMSANPGALIFGTDFPSTRAPRPYSEDDIGLIYHALGEEPAKRVLCDNAVALYKPEDAISR